MPRMARIKSEEAIYHVMVRSISELSLFREDKDKDTYLSLVHGYQNVFGFKVYAFCLMDNHAHFIIDANGSDISKVMHSLNFKYAQIYNFKYKRHGHLFQDRFKSKIVTTERYLFTLSAYIHRNPEDIEKYSKCIEKYKYSSLGVFLGLRRDQFRILDEGFIMQMFGNSIKESRSNYMKFVYACDDKKLKEDAEFGNETTCYKSERKIIVRDFSPDEILNYVSEETGINKTKFHIKNGRKTTEGRALAVLLMRGFCNFRCSDICKVLGNITQSRVSGLCSIAMNLIDKDENYKKMVNDFLIKYAA